MLSLKKKLTIIGALKQKPVGSVPQLNAQQINAAFKAAQSAQGPWSLTRWQTRASFLKKLTQELKNNANKLAKMMEQEIAKPLAQGQQEVLRSIEYINLTIATYQKVMRKKITAEGKTATIYRVPLGVVLAISPFNYPVNLSLSKIVPALLAGNSVVFKPATNGSLVGYLLATLFDALKLPPGVFNFLTGSGSQIGDLLTKHPAVSMISFTGGIKVGQRIAKLRPLVPIVLELGGNDAAYVRSDADLKKAAQSIAKGAFGYAGQRCTAIKRLILHADIKDAFLPLLIKEARHLPTLPLVNTAAADWVSKMLQEPVNKILLGGKRRGNQFENTIVQTSPSSLSWQEEAFGPLLPVVVCDSDEKALKLINDTHYGLQNSLYTSDYKWARSVANQIESGSVNINGASSRGPDQFPFLGIKDSGVGVQGVEDALLSMSRYLNVVE